MTFMILGDICTRKCRFCAVKTGKPQPPDPSEPERVARAIKDLSLRYAVITSVDRDDLEDGGAGHFAETVLKIKEHTPHCRIELLIPDFKGSHSALMKVLASKPDVLGHNVETVPRLYPSVRPQGNYSRSLRLLQRAKSFGITVKTGFMVGLGEEWEEVLQMMWDIKATGCDILTIGQYLQPTKDNLPVVRYYSPWEFELLRTQAEQMGFQHVESGPLVRSSYRAGRDNCVIFKNLL